MNRVNEHLQSRIGTAAVTKRDTVFLEELFHWLLTPAHFPEAVSAIGRSRSAKKFRAYQLLLERLRDFMQRFPEDKTQLGEVCSILASMVSKETEARRGQVSYHAKDQTNSWYVRKGPQPAVAPRLLFAACIAKELYPKKSPYNSVWEELKRNGHHMEKRSVELQVWRPLANPKKYHVYGAGPTTDLAVLLRQELFDFKIWKEDQRDRTNMSTEEFDGQFEEYLDRIHPTPKDLVLLHCLLDNFYNTRKTGSH